MDEEKIKIQMDDGVARFFTRFGGNLHLLICTALRAHVIVVEALYKMNY